MDGVERGDRQHRCTDSKPAKIAAQGESVSARQHHVQGDRIVRGGRGHPHGFIGVGCQVGRESLCGQTFPQQASELGLVLDNQDSHRVKDFTIIVGEP